MAINGLKRTLTYPQMKKIELGNYVISYYRNFQENGTSFVELVTFDKKVGFKGSEKFYQLRSFSGSKEIRELEDKIIFFKFVNCPQCR